MSPLGRDAPPESKSTSGLASVFKSLTGIRASKNPSPHSHSPTRQHVTENGGIRNKTYRGAPDYKSLFEQLKPGNSLPTRIDAADSLRLAVQEFPVSGVTSIFKRARDLIDPLNPVKARAAGYKLLTACAQNTALTDPERLAYFRVLTVPRKIEDFQWQLSALIELTKHGRDLAGFHYETLPVLTTWLRQTWAFTSSLRKQDRGMPPFSQEKNLALLLVFIVDVIKFSFNVSNEQTLGDLIDVILSICIHSNSPDDLRSCINVIDAIVTYGDFPSCKLADCVKVLCCIHFGILSDVQPEVWRSISNICISHNGKNTVRIVLGILRDSQETKQSLREKRGAVLVLEKIFCRNGENGYPLVPFSLLIKSLAKVAMIEDVFLRSDILRLIISILGDGTEVLENVMEEDWSLMFDVIVNCTSQATKETDSYTTAHHKMGIFVDNENLETMSVELSQNLQKLIIRIQTLLVQHSGIEFFQRTDCIKFLVSVHEHLPETCARLLIDLYMEYRYCYPSDLNWKENISTILRCFFNNRLQSSQIRLHALRAVTEAFHAVEAVKKYTDRETTQDFVHLITEGIRDENHIMILQEIMKCATTVAEATVDNKYFFAIVDTIRESILTGKIRPKLTSSASNLSESCSPGPNSNFNNFNQTPSNVVAKSLIKLFISCMNKSKTKVSRIFTDLLWILKSEVCEADVRISTLRLLCRLRADWANRIFLISFTESDSLAALFYRTPDSLAKKKADDKLQQERESRLDESSLVTRSASNGKGHVQAKYAKRKISGNPRLIQQNHQMWMEPDLGPLPQYTSCKVSSILVSTVSPESGLTEECYQVEDHKPSGDNYVRATTNRQAIFAQDQPIALDISNYLQTIITLIQKNCDWETYSYIIVHLPSQLANQALFTAAIPQIRVLREVICDQIKNKSIQQPPVSSGLRKSDVSICFFQILNVVMSYHRHFSKNEEDEIVRSFLHGVGEKTSKCCIHALSICCHELPGSTSKVLATILTRMSQIITQSHVAVHILEFLACLARLPNLYVNFREEEYRIVFAICFRYLQYVRDQKNKDIIARNSATNSRIGPDSSRSFPETISSESILYPTSSDDLPEYVYALTYHVIIIWFLSLKLADRAGQVRWITKNLISKDVNGREIIDEQAQVTLDFIQRVAYADVEESGPDPSFKKEVFGEINRKRWIVGNSLLTIEQASRGDWAQIIKHQPSGTSYYIIQEKFSRPPPHQAHNFTDALKNTRHSDQNVKLPSHLLLQLFASSPMSRGCIRPIPLPDCKTVDRAVSNLNRIFTVVGHKVGVIYIGENQKDEIEILSNIHGSSDYTNFLSGLGTLTKLRGANFNTQGLDRQADTDGEYTICWRDRVTEIIFHVTTQMPTDLSSDPQCSNKKRHIGNDFVNIIFNNSGMPFSFNTFPSEFNYVNIVITPETRATFVSRRLQSKLDNAFYKVQVMSKPGFPEISPAAETKIISLSNLPNFVRLLALNASVFSLVWAQRTSGEHFSAWRSRLREIKKMRELLGFKHMNNSLPFLSHEVVADSRNTRDSVTSLRRSSVSNFLTHSTEPSFQKPSDHTTSETEIRFTTFEEDLVETLDFSDWA